MKRALVTGASGFVGSHLVPLLHENGFEVWATWNRYKRKFDFPVRWIHAGLTESKIALRLVQESRPDYVFHLAGQTSLRFSWSDPGRTLQTNVAATIFLLEGVVRFAPEARVVLASSIQVYGQAFTSGRRASETDHASPLSPYAGSKLLMELAGMNFVTRHNVSAVIARGSNQVGTGQDATYAFSNFCRQIAMMERGKQPPILEVGNIDVVRDFIHIRDAVRAYVLLARRGKKGEIYNVSVGKGVLLKEGIQFLQKETKVRFKIKRLSSRFHPNDLPYAVTDSSKLRKLGWQPEASVWQAIRELLNEWRERVKYGP